MKKILYFSFIVKTITAEYKINIQKIDKNGISREEYKTSLGKNDLKEIYKSVFEKEDEDFIAFVDNKKISNPNYLLDLKDVKEIVFRQKHDYKDINIEYSDKLKLVFIENSKNILYKIKKFNYYLTVGEVNRIIEKELGKEYFLLDDNGYKRNEQHIFSDSIIKINYKEENYLFYLFKITYYENGKKETSIYDANVFKDFDFILKYFIGEKFKCYIKKSTPVSFLSLFWLKYFGGQIYEIETDKDGKILKKTPLINDKTDLEELGKTNLKWNILRDGKRYEYEIDFKKELEYRDNYFIGYTNKSTSYGHADIYPKGLSDDEIINYCLAFYNITRNDVGIIDKNALSSTIIKLKKGTTMKPLKFFENYIKNNDYGDDIPDSTNEKNLGLKGANGGLCSKLCCCCNVNRG